MIFYVQKKVNTFAKKALVHTITKSKYLIFANPLKEIFLIQ